jgi:hypothetical protein
MNEYEGSESNMGEERKGDVCKIGQRKGTYDTCNLIGSKF